MNLTAYTDYLIHWLENKRQELYQMDAYTLGVIYQLGKDKEFEHQCLHGMGETLYDQVVGPQNLGRRVRVYAPVGTHETLLAYLVRRLLENGANSSFVNQIVDENISIDDLVKSPLDAAAATQGKMHAALPLPKNLYGDKRPNSRGFDFSNEFTLQQLERDMNAAAARPIQAASITAVPVQSVAPHDVQNPADHSDILGNAAFLHPDAVADIISTAKDAESRWAAVAPAARAAILRRIAARLDEKHLSYSYLDGQTPAEERLHLVNAFNAGDTPAFLISLKAGGTGLNLTGADMVVHYDPWWNPAVEEQATDRAYRIGQENKVQVLKLIAKDTIEEKIFALQKRKKALIDQMIRPGENFLTKLSEEELKSLFR